MYKAEFYGAKKIWIYLGDEVMVGENVKGSKIYKYRKRLEAEILENLQRIEWNIIILNNKWPLRTKTV